MTTPFRIATYNVENLFERSKLLNFRDNAVGDEKLAKLESLKAELGRTKYDAPSIIELYDELKDYVTIVEERGKLFKGSSRTTLSAKGKADWDGFVALKRAKFDDTARANTAEIIRRVNADVQALVEVEDRPTLEHFCADRLKATAHYVPCSHQMVIDGNDDRGIDVGVASRFPIGAMYSHVDDRSNGKTIFSRDCLEIEVAAPGGSIWLLINHLKSKGFGATSTSNAKREAQAKRVVEILGRFDLAKDRVVVLGDFNDTPDSRPLSALLELPHLHDVLALAFPNDPAARWTYHYEKNQQIDYLLVSEPLRYHFVAAGVERGGIFDVQKFDPSAQPLPHMAKYTDAASDHGAVWADFALA